MDWIWMHHPEHGGVTRTRRDAFDGLWAGKGWVEVTEDDARLLEASGGVSLERLTGETKAVLADVAARAGVEVDPSATKSEIVEAIKKR